MPILNLKISAEPTPTLLAAINHLLLDLTEQVLGKPRDLTAIAIDHIPPEAWTVGGRTLRKLGRHSFFLEIKVTDETNTKAEKARYIAEVFAGFQRLIGPLDDKSYVHVQDVRAAAYGYGGQTQEWRYHAP